jgi:ribonuclease HI
VLAQTVIPRIERWENESGATFEASKTKLVHFSRKRAAPNAGIRVKGEDVAPSDSAKLLGVVLDARLRWDQHIARAATKAKLAAMALKRLRGLKPETARQLYLAPVAPVMDYASPVWSAMLMQRHMGRLRQAQGIGAKAIIGAFKTVSLPIAEAEAQVEPIELRHREQRRGFWIKSHTLPIKHPFWKLRRLATEQCRRLRSPLHHIAEDFRETDLSQLERIRPFCMPPWMTGANVTVQGKDEAKAVAEAVEHGTLKIFTDASTRNGLSGIGAAFASGKTLFKKLVGRATNNHRAELIAIAKAVASVQYLNKLRSRVHTVHIYTDCQSVLDVLTRPRQQDNQALVDEIVEMTRKMESQGCNLEFRWVPAHSGVRGNEAANRLARETTSERFDLPREPGACRADFPRDTQKTMEEWRRMINMTTTGRFTKDLDGAIPQKHTKRLYDNLTRADASILSQLRTNKSRLNASLAPIGAAECETCECGQVETTRHFLLECPRWVREREQIKRVAQARWQDMSFLLGGWSDTKRADGTYVDGPKDRWKPNCDVVRAVIDFAKQTGRLNTGLP